MSTKYIKVMICCTWMLLDELWERDRNPILAKVTNNSQVWFSPGWVWLLVGHVAMSLSELWNVPPKDKTSLIHTAAEENTAKVSCQPANHSRDNRKKLSKIFGKRSPFSVISGSYQDNAKNKWVHLFFVLWLQKPFHHLPPAGPSGSWCRQKSELCTAYSFCAPLPLPNPAFCSGNVNPPLLFGTPEVCSSLWSGLSGLTVAVESRMHSRLEIIWLQCFFSCIYNVTLQSLSPSSLIKPATLP